MAINRSFLRAAQISNTAKRVWDMFLDLYDDYIATVSAAELLVLDGVTAGTVTASKAVVVDANKDAGDFRNLDAVNIDAGASGTAGTVDIYPATASKGKFTLSVTDQTGDTAVTLKPAAMGQATQVNIPDPGAAASYVVQSTAAVTLAEADVLDGATAGTAVASKALVVDANKNITGLGSVLSTAPTGGGIGYATGAGGAVTQLTNRSTGVTLSKLTGQITTDTTSLAAEASADFVVTNTTVAIGDVVVVAIQSGSNSGGTIVSVSTVAAGSFTIRVHNGNVAAGTAETGAIIINFAVIKAVAA